MDRRDSAKSIPFKVGVGNKIEMWQKIMKEVEAGRYVGPFDSIPYDNYIQSPIGLVPKAGGKTRLIIHLLYCFKKPDGTTVLSLNTHTLKDKCNIQYHDLDRVLQTCFILNETENIYFSKTNVQIAFRILPLKPSCFCWLAMKAEKPLTGKTVFFIEKCLPFGASISCSHFQRFSNALRHIFEHKTGCTMVVTNYLDDFLFVENSEAKCNELVRIFLQICKEIGVLLQLKRLKKHCSDWYS